jgi:catechol-2,3-dioxygenase
MIQSPRALAHVVYRSSRFAEMRDWYAEVLVAHVAFQDGWVCFMTYDEEHHRIAIISDPEVPPRAATSVVDHISFAYDSLPTLLDTYDRLEKVGIKPYWTVNHGPTTSFYYADPDGNHVELQIDNYDTLQELQALFSTPQFAENPRGIEVDPAALRRRLAQGESLDTVRKRADMQ